MSGSEAGRDWVAWHREYDTDGPLARRLAIVQREIEKALSGRAGTDVRVLSICSGDGRDLLGSAVHLGGEARILGRLVELDPTLAARARAHIEAIGLPSVEVIEADAGTTAAYAGAVPADLVLVCGVFGNIADQDIERTVRALPMLCAPGAIVIWTRHRRPPDLTPAIRDWFGAAGFRHEGYYPVADSPGTVGVERFAGDALPFSARRRLFRFRRGD